jgi:hypothetical protein
MKDHREDLEALLVRTPHLDDDGFTEALMARLPARRHTLRMRTAIPLACALASCAAVAAVPGARRLLAEIGLALVGGVGTPGPSPFAVAAVVAVLVWGAVAAAASEA